MRQIRRNDYAPRVELAPMIDVIFLLLTFFVYCMVIMINAQVLPVTLTPLSTGQRAAASSNNVGLTLDKDGHWHWKRETQALLEAELTDHLTQFKADPSKPRLFVAMEAQGSVDRGPQLLGLIEKLHELDIQDFTIVGQPSGSGGGSTVVKDRQEKNVPGSSN